MNLYLFPIRENTDRTQLFPVSYLSKESLCFRRLSDALSFDLKYRKRFRLVKKRQAVFSDEVLSRSFSTVCQKQSAILCKYKARFPSPEL